jgi:putative ABC transport system permease protein
VYLLSYLRQFLRDVRGQKLRTFLTVFGIVWGTAAVSLLLAFGEGLQGQMEKQQKGLGENIVICWPSRTSKPWRGLPKGRRVRVEHDDIEYLRREVPEIARISGEFEVGGADYRIALGRKTLLPDVHGVRPEFAEMRNLVAEAGGRFLDARDMRDRKRVVFIGDQLKKDLFGDQPAVGREIRIGRVPFLVVGVLQKKEQDSSYSGPDEDKAIVPYDTFAAMYGRRWVGNFVFQVSDPADVGAAKKGVVAALARKHGFDPDDEEAVGMWDVTEGMEFFETFFLAFRAFLGIVGALTLVVGGIGVSNIMNVVVEERTKEIGIKMALGAKRGYVLGQFLFEALLLTAIGGAAGFLITGGICSLVPAFEIEEYIGVPRLSTLVTGSTTGVLGLVGFLAAWFPAKTAANLRPVEALRM